MALSVLVLVNPLAAGVLDKVVAFGAANVNAEGEVSNERISMLESSLTVQEYRVSMINCCSIKAQTQLTPGCHQLRQ